MTASDGTTLQQLLAAMLAQRLGISPAEAMQLAADPNALMQQMMTLREREQDDASETGESVQMGSQIERLRQRIDQCERQFGFALAVVDHAAQLLGSCRRCLGFDGDCERCHGRGRPGARPSTDPNALRRWAGGAARWLQPS